MNFTPEVTAILTWDEDDDTLRIEIDVKEPKLTYSDTIRVISVPEITRAEFGTIGVVNDYPRGDAK